MTYSEAMFGFKGRIRRLAYFGYSIALTVLFGALIVGGMLSFDGAGEGSCWAVRCPSGYRWGCLVRTCPDREAPT